MNKKTRRTSLLLFRKRFINPQKTVMFSWEQNSTKKNGTRKFFHYDSSSFFSSFLELSYQREREESR